MAVRDALLLLRHPVGVPPAEDAGNFIRQRRTLGRQLEHAAGFLFHRQRWAVADWLAATSGSFATTVVVVRGGRTLVEISLTRSRKSRACYFFFFTTLTALAAAAFLRFCYT